MVVVVILIVGLVVIGLVVVVGVVVTVIAGHRNLSLKFGQNWVNIK